MPLTKSTGNMYDWVTHTHCHLGGQCPHGCSYCYVDNPRFGRPAKYQGELRLIEDELKVKYGEGKTIFIENNNDLFADEVQFDFIQRITRHCYDYPDNTYVFQTKNPERMVDLWLNDDVNGISFPNNTILGCTIETNRHYPDIMREAPLPESRAFAMGPLQGYHVKTFLTIEPILDFDLVPFVNLIMFFNPGFINIGADSKGHGLIEPPIGKVRDLISTLVDLGFEIRAKRNLDRLEKRQS